VDPPALEKAIAAGDVLVLPEWPTDNRARFWELRASISVARLWRDQSKRSEARDDRTNLPDCRQCSTLGEARVGVKAARAKPN